MIKTTKIVFLLVSASAILYGCETLNGPVIDHPVVGTWKWVSFETPAGVKKRLKKIFICDFIAMKNLHHGQPLGVKFRQVSLSLIMTAKLS